MATTSVTLAPGSLSVRPRGKRLLKRLQSDAVEGRSHGRPDCAFPVASCIWYCYNNGAECDNGGRARHAWVHARFELQPAVHKPQQNNQMTLAPEIRYLIDQLECNFFFMRYDLTMVTSADGPATVLFQEHWSETNPDILPHSSFTECVKAELPVAQTPPCGAGSTSWTRAQIKALIVDTWADCHIYHDVVGGSADGTFADSEGGKQRCPTDPDGVKLNNCVTFARHLFYLMSESRRSR